MLSDKTMSECGVCNIEWFNNVRVWSV